MGVGATSKFRELHKNPDPNRAKKLESNFLSNIFFTAFFL